MIITTTEQIEGKRITEVLGIVQGVGDKRGGGEDTMETVVRTASTSAFDDMKGKAPEGCDAIVSTRISVVAPVNGIATVLVYGTAVALATPSE